MLYNTIKMQYSSVNIVPRNVRPEHRDPILTTSTLRYPVSHPLGINGSLLGVMWRRSVTPAILHLFPNLIMRGVKPPFEKLHGDEIMYSDYATSHLLQLIMGWSRKNVGMLLLQEIRATVILSLTLLRDESQALKGNSTKLVRIHLTMI